MRYPAGRVDCWNGVWTRQGPGQTMERGGDTPVRLMAAQSKPQGPSIETNTTDTLATGRSGRELVITGQP